MLGFSGNFLEDGDFTISIKFEWFMVSPKNPEFPGSQLFFWGGGVSIRGFNEVCGDLAKISLEYTVIYFYIIHRWIWYIIGTYWHTVNGHFSTLWLIKWYSIALLRPLGHVHVLRTAACHCRTGTSEWIREVKVNQGSKFLGCPGQNIWPHFEWDASSSFILSNEFAFHVQNFPTQYFL